MNPSLIEAQLSAGVLTLTLNRPDKLNAIHRALSDALLDAVTAAASNPAVRVLLLRGAGRSFCAGRDVSEAPSDADLAGVQAVARALFTLPQPTVAAVQGWAVGAGLEWMLNTDLVIAAESGKFRLPEASLGVFVAGGLTATLAASIGSARAKALMLLGEPFDARQALDWGLLWRVVPDDALAVASQSLCARLAALAPHVARTYKRVLNEVTLANFDRALAAETAAQRSFDAAARSAS